MPDTALTVNVEVPAIVGVPVIAPLEEFSVKPAGSVPDNTDHVTPEVFAARVAEYAVPVVAAGRLVVVIVRAEGAGSGAAGDAGKNFH